MNKKRSFEVNERVFAKVRGFPAWPARITALANANGSRYKVFFYGTYETATLKKEEIWEYNESSKAKFGKGNAKRKGFAEGMYEIENMPDLGNTAPEAAEEETPTDLEQKNKAPAPSDPPPEEPAPPSAPVKEAEERNLKVQNKEGPSSSPLPTPQTAPTPPSPSEKPPSEEVPASSELKSEGKAEEKKPQPSEEEEQQPPTPQQQQQEEEEEEEENALVINETTPVTRTRPNRGNKRKAEDSAPSAPPPAKKKSAPPPTNVTPSTNESTPSTTVSRSGRVIKPKKFVDDEEEQKPVPVTRTNGNSKTQVESASIASGNNASITATTPTVTTNSNNNKTPTSAKKEPRKMWVEVKSTGDMIEINLDQDKPSHFESKEAELQWERATARNALKFKERVESGDFIPDEVRVKLEEKINRTEEEEKILKKARQNSLKMEKIRWLKIEQRLVDIDIDIKTSCSIQKPDVEECLRNLGELDSMVVAPLMLKKQPDIVTTIRKLRRYVGPKEPDTVPEIEAEKIRNKADRVYSKLKSIFEIPEGMNFDDAFRDELEDFQNATKYMEKEKVLTLVSDPTKKSKKKK